MWCPFATQDPVNPHSSLPLVGHSLGLVLHDNEGESDPHLTFSLGKANSHWQVSDGVEGYGEDGELFQYVDSDLQSWAQEDGNGTYHSVETAGFTTTPLTPKQVATLVKLYVWGHQTYGWPLQVTDTVDVGGFGAHRMGGVAWGNHPCPGDIRAAQRAGIIAAAAAIISPPTLKAVTPLALTTTLVSGTVVCVDSGGAVWGIAGKPNEYYGALNHHAGASYGLPAGWSVYGIEPRADGGYTIIVTAPAYAADATVAHDPFRGFDYRKADAAGNPAPDNGTTAY